MKKADFKDSTRKKRLTSLLVFITIVIKSQVAIGKTSVTNNSVSLEFANTENKGLIIPYVETKTDITENGTVIYDVTDHKTKYLKDGSWFDLSVDTTGQSNISIQQSKTELTTAKTIIGTNASDSATGILVLSDTNKAMILPKLESPHLNIITPAPGMIAYDTVKKQLAVYNGTVWSFWKP
jgi:hypothetical protein